MTICIERAARANLPIVVTHPGRRETRLPARAQRQAASCATSYGHAQFVHELNLSGSLGRRRLMKLLQEGGDHTALAAERTGIHRSTIYRRMRRK